MLKYHGRKRMNSVQLMGNLAKDVELRYTANGKPVATFTVAATNTYRDPNGDAKEFTAREIGSLYKADYRHAPMRHRMAQNDM